MNALKHFIESLRPHRSNELRSGALLSEEISSRMLAVEDYTLCLVLINEIRVRRTHLSAHAKIMPTKRAIAANGKTGRLRHKHDYGYRHTSFL